MSDIEDKADNWDACIFVLKILGSVFGLLSLIYILSTITMTMQKVDELKKSCVNQNIGTK